MTPMKEDKEKYLFELEGRIARARKEEEYSKLEKELEAEYKKAQEMRDTKVMEEILRLSTHLFILRHDYGKVDKLYKKWEELCPRSVIPKWNFALFYYHCRADLNAVIRKIDEMEIDSNAEAHNSELITYYSALNLKGLAHLALGETSAALKVLDLIIELLTTSIARVHYPVELNFVEELVKKKIGLYQCKKYLSIVKNYIRGEETRRKFATLSGIIESK